MSFAIEWACIFLPIGSDFIKSAPFCKILQVVLALLVGVPTQSLELALILVRFINVVCSTWHSSRRQGFVAALNCNCNYILFTKLPWPGDSEGTFRSSS